MQFLMGLDEVYAPIRSIIHITDPIPNDKGAFATLSRDESHRSAQSHNVSKTSNGNTAFVAKTNSRNNSCSNTNNNWFKRLNRLNLLCTHCNMNGHTAARCFELVRYPPNFKKRNGTIKVYKRLMALISEKSRSSSIPANVEDVSKLNMTVGHPNGTKAVVTHIGSLSSECKEYEMQYQKTNNLNLFDLDLEDNYESDDPYDDGRDKEFKKSKGINPTSSEVTKNTDFTRRDEVGHPDDSDSAEAVSDVKENAPLKENDRESEGDDSYYQEFNDMFQPGNNNPDIQDNVNLRRSFRQTGKLRGSKLDQKEETDYEETFSPVVKIVTVTCILALSVQNNWSVYQLDINNAFLYGDLVEDVYMSLPEGIEVLESKNSLILTRRKYCLELLFEFGMLSCDPCRTSIKVNLSNVKKNVVVLDEPLVGVNSYQKRVGKLIYLTHTIPDISYAVYVLSQYMHALRQLHLKLAFRVLRYLKNFPGKGIAFNKSSSLDLIIYVDFDWDKCKVTRNSITGYSVFLGNNVLSWKSKKQSVLAKYSIEAQYRAMNSVTCEVIWIMKILNELNVKVSLPITINCDNSSAIQIAANLVFHEKTKHIEIELFFLREKVVTAIVKTVKVKSEDNVGDVFTKGLSIDDHNKFCRMLKLKDLYHN
ncbi:ribonuclease H-like domain-containing protein [Tanacetum coccineum]|uniref:Ribonuclease H-like domain-containing protein n=1 Tax=Tanacetum coccineum TaxID=301880 RepID=A0ABQ5GAM8_9ASTR